MKIKPGYILRQIIDNYVIIGVGEAAYAPYEIMTLNETGAFLWRMLENEAKKSDLVVSIKKEYGVDEHTADNDVEVFLGELRKKDLLDE